MKTILVPLDGSKLAELVLPYVLELAAMFEARLHLLQIIPDLQPLDIFVEGAVGQEYRDGVLSSPMLMRREAEQYLERQVSVLRASGATVVAEVCIGLAAEWILHVAERENAMLIALASHGYSGLKRWALGSVADKVMHSALTPILIVQSSMRTPAEHWNIRRILVPLDGSQLARQALPLAAELAAHTHAELLPLTVTSPYVLGELGGRETFERVPQTLVEQLRHELGSVDVRLREQHITVIPVVARGLVASTIADQAEQLDADVIVMATHGASGLRRWALGSITDKVLHIATTPMLVVRAQSAAMYS